MSEYYLPVSIQVYKKGMEDGLSRKCCGDCHCDYFDDGDCLDKPDDYDCPHIEYVPYIVVSNQNAVIVRPGDYIVTLPLFGKMIFTPDEFKKLFVGISDEHVHGKYLATVGKIMEGAIESDVNKFVSYANLLADNLQKDGDEHGARLIRSKLDGSYKNSPKIITHDNGGGLMS